MQGAPHRIGLSNDLEKQMRREKIPVPPRPLVTDVVYSNVRFERYADDCVFHCSTCTEAETLLKALDNRLKECHLPLHPEKTKIVYCKDSNRKGCYPEISFDFLGYTFRPRSAKAKHGRIFTGYTPALSPKALKRISDTVRRWKLQRWSGHTIEDIARALNPVIAGWVNYYGHFWQEGALPHSKSA